MQSFASPSLSLVEPTPPTRGDRVARLRDERRELEFGRVAVPA